jgi:UDP-2,4-diacetamido-2,4,6-trideoxy-beta-L-altropyranose hydrolase
MKVLFRADASVEIGSGHIVRCLTLADSLREKKAVCEFVCRDAKGNLINTIESRGYRVHLLPPISIEDQKSIESAGAGVYCFGSDAEETKYVIGIDSFYEWIVVDHYSLDENWEKLLRPFCNRLMVIDDLANRRHDCDLLLDQNYYKNSSKRYQGLLPPNCTTLLGPSYILLRKEFVDAKNNLHFRNGIIKRILVFFGSSDLSNETAKVLVAIKKLALESIQVDVVVGTTNPHRHNIEIYCNLISNVNYYCNISNMAELILRADIGIGAGGSSIWERCYLGLPSITSVVASNQIKTTKDVASMGALDYVGCSKSLSSDNYAAALLKAIANPNHVKLMSSKALSLVSGVGTPAIVDVMQKMLDINTSRFFTAD